MAIEGYCQHAISQKHPQTSAAKGNAFILKY